MRSPTSSSPNGICAHDASPGSRWPDRWRTRSEGEHEHYNPAHGADAAGEETDGSEEAAGGDDAAELDEGLDGEDEEDEEGNEVLLTRPAHQGSPSFSSSRAGSWRE